jgi:cation diffusion facilitator family transporter
MSHAHSHHGDEKQKVASISLIASACLALLKFIAALLTGSLGLLSEAVHSLVDFGATAVTWFAVRWSNQPADDDHHFGHAKIESVAALFETFLLIGIALFIAYEAIHRLLTGNSDVEVTWWSVGILIISIIVDLNRSRALLKTAKETHSVALAADAAHFQSDMWGSFAVLLGLIGVWFGFAQADAVAAILVSCVIGYIGWHLGKDTLQSLLDAAPEGLTNDVRAIASNTDRVLAVNQLRVKPAGPINFITLDVDVSRMLPHTEIQKLKEELAANILAKHQGADVTVVTNPVAVDNETAFDKIALVANQRGLAIHHLTVQDLDGKLAVSFDLEVEGTSTLRVAHKQATELEDAIRKSLGGNVEVESHIEPLPLRQLTGQPADTKTTRAIELAIQKIAKPESLLSDIHNIRIRESEGGLYIHYHCRFAPGEKVESVHKVVDRIENALKTKFKRIQRVVAHAEPVGHKRHKL